MDGCWLLLPQHGICERTCLGAAPTFPKARRPTDMGDKHVALTGDEVERQQDSPRESSLIVYCGDEQQVREGFAIALRAMGIEAHLLA